MPTAWLRSGQHITSVGSDDSSKCEIAPGALASARIFVDSILSEKEYGSTRRAISAEEIKSSDLKELGSLVDRQFLRHPNDTTIASLSGLGVQDLTAANQFCGALSPVRG